MTPVPDRAKAIEAAMESLRVGRSEKALLRDFLAALEAEGWGLTCTREGERGGDRMCLLLALFDTRDGTPLADLVRAAREGWERSHPDMGRDENGRAWEEFDALWPRRAEALSSHTREAERLREALTRIYQCGRGRHVEIAREALSSGPVEEEEKP